MPSASLLVVTGVETDLMLELKNLFKSEIKQELLRDLKAELYRTNGTGKTNPTNGLTNGHTNGLTNGHTNGAVGNTATHPSVSPSIFTPICHPNVEEVSQDVDGYYLQHWPFSDAIARKKFVAAGFSRVTCLYFPKALEERIRFACSLLTILFLVDDQLEDMSLQDGEDYNNSLMPFCRGNQQPDRNVPVQWMMYDLWQDMRRCDKELADEVLEPVFLFMRAQTSKERLAVKGLGSYLQYRQGDVGQALLAALMRFSMGLSLPAADMKSVDLVEKNCGRHISVVNDIFSYEKELHTSKTAHKEGGYLCSAVPIFAEETELSIAAAKRGLWALVREWELVHNELVKGRVNTPEGCSESLRAYMDGIEYHMSGNELWSKTTKRYQVVSLQ